jgi:outer membrane immunogenic protein
MRRQIVYAAAMLVLSATPGLADRSTPFTWTGLYVGIGGGAGALSNIQSESIPGFGTVFSETFAQQSYSGVVTAGYDYRVAPQVVIGALFDYEITRFQINNASLGFVSLPAERARTWSVGARIGLLANPTTLLYVLAGYAHSTMDVRDVGDVEFNGHFVGGGIETRLAGGWFLRGEYRFTQFAEQTLLTCFCADLNAEPAVHSGRVVLVYRFGQSPPP